MGEGFAYVPDGVAPQKEDLAAKNEAPEVLDDKLWAQLESQAESIINQIQEKILRHDYSFVIGDDASGRLPALLFSKLLANIYEKDGLKKPETRFLAGSGDLVGQEAEAKKKVIEDYLREQVLPEVAARKGKVMIVTDTIYTGKSLMPLVDALASLRIPCDIVTLQFIPGYASKNTMEANIGAHIYAGEENEINPEIYGRSELSGVHKDVESLHAESNAHLPKEDGKYDTKVLAEARQKTAGIADKLTEKLENMPKKKSGIFDIFKR